MSTDSWTVGFWYDASLDLWAHPTLTNTNSLIREDSSEYFDGAYGVKTGTSGQAGSNLVSAATRRECPDVDDGLCTNRDVIAVALGAAADGTATGDRFSDSRSLLEFGLSV